MTREQEIRQRMACVPNTTPLTVTLAGDIKVRLPDQGPHTSVANFWQGQNPRRAAALAHMFAHAGVDLNYLLEALEAERRHSETLEAERDAARKNLADLENEVEDLLDRVQDRDNRISLLEEALANAGGRLALRGDPA